MTKNRKPNILFLFTDDQRFDTIRALNNPQIITPTMDHLVARGTSFTHAHIMGGSCPAVCMPSRAMLHTGRTLFHLSGSGEQIPDDHLLLGEWLQQHGYQTFGTGKWHNGPGSYARSFTAGGNVFFGGMDDHWNVPACDFSPNGNYPEPKPHPWNGGTGSIEMLPKSFDHVRRGKHSTELFADTAIDYLNKVDTSTPFFMYVSFMAPHDPRTMPQRFLNMYDPAKIVLPENFMPAHPFDNGEMNVRDENLAARPRSPAEIQRHIAEYYGMISHLDYEIGRILDALRATGEFENTLVLLAGDNGLAIGRHGLMGKQNLYEHSVRVPLVIAGPGIHRGETRDTLCYLLDIFPTLCSFAEIPIPKSVEGRSLRPSLHDAAVQVRDHLPLAYGRVQRGIRDARYKLIEYVVDRKRHTQLFDLVHDPNELTNLSERQDMKEILTLLQRQLREWREKLDDPADEIWAALQ
ncbi:MAG TPA: sulfatase-like hydrolase/transferase [Spirochaetia bacterium]|nr:sulfatase-like hydrolase/transferase [Spirochaetia bacterium]